MTYPRTMAENTSHNVTSRKRKSRALKTKRKRATELGVTLIEGGLVAVNKKEFTVFQWDEEKGDYMPTLSGTLD